MRLLPCVGCRRMEANPAGLHSLLSFRKLRSIYSTCRASDFSVWETFSWEAGQLFAITIGICPEGKISYLSEVGPAAEKTGHARDSWVGTISWEACHHAQRARARSAFAECLLTGETVTLDMDTEVSGISERWRVRYHRVRMPIAVIARSTLIEERDDRCLTNRERQIVCLMVRDCTVQEIAETIGCSESTVSTHQANIRAKIGVKTNAGIAVFGLRSGI